jgi:hypothetical protein
MGIFSTSRVFEALGYRAAECYSFEDKHLGAIYYQVLRIPPPRHLKM